MTRCSGPSPRIFVYDIPRSLLDRPTHWRLVSGIGEWIRNSPHWERQGDCADFFFVPMHPENMVNHRMVGDASFARLYAYIRETWPYWNRTVDEGTARHFQVLPCDHGPGDCGYDRPLIPNKWTPGHSLVEQNQRNRVSGFLNRSDAEYIRRTWGGQWEQLNPASPSRLVFNLVYNGWADQLRSKSGHCRSCFHHGLDVSATPARLHACTPQAQTITPPSPMPELHGTLRRSGCLRPRATPAAHCVGSGPRKWRLSSSGGSSWLSARRWGRGRRGGGGGGGRGGRGGTASRSKSCRRTSSRISSRISSV